MALFELYRQVREEGYNLFLSPYGVSSALATTCAGARGEAEREMAQALRFTLGTTEEPSARVNADRSESSLWILMPAQWAGFDERAVVMVILLGAGLLGVAWGVPAPNSGSEDRTDKAREFNEGLVSVSGRLKADHYDLKEKGFP